MNQASLAFFDPPKSTNKMSVAFCLPVGTNEPPCSTLFSYLYAEHSHGRGFLQFLSKNDLISLASTCKEAYEEIASFRWNNFLRKVKERSSKEEHKESYWENLVNSRYSHIPIREIVYVKEINPVSGHVQASDKKREFVIRIRAKYDWHNPSRPPQDVYFFLSILNEEFLKTHEGYASHSLGMNTYNEYPDEKVKDILIDNRRSHVMCFEEHSLNERMKRASKGELLLYDYTWRGVPRADD